MHVPIDSSLLFNYYRLYFNLWACMPEINILYLYPKSLN